MMTAADPQTLRSNPPRFRRAQIALSYLANAKGKLQRRYLHLLDGGISDNIGLRAPLAALRSSDSGWRIQHMINTGQIKKLVVITVDARTAPDSSIGQTPSPPDLTSILKLIATVPMENYSFDTVDLLRSTFNSWSRAEKTYKQTRALVKNYSEAMKKLPPPPPSLDLYQIYVGFDRIPDSESKRRHYFMNLPTTFRLSPRAVNDLIREGRVLVRTSPDFQRLVKSLSK